MINEPRIIAAIITSLVALLVSVVSAYFSYRKSKTEKYIKTSESQTKYLNNKINLLNTERLKLIEFNHAESGTGNLKNKRVFMKELAESVNSLITLVGRTISTIDPYISNLKMKDIKSKLNELNSVLGYERAKYIGLQTTDIDEELVEKIKSDPVTFIANISDDLRDLIEFEMKKCINKIESKLEM